MSKSILPRLLVLVEVLLAFAVVYVAYRSFKHFTPLGRFEVGEGLNFSPGATMILFSVAMIGLRRRSFDAYGLTVKDWPYHLNLGIFWALFGMMVAGCVLATGLIQFDPLTPPDLPRALAASAGVLVFTLLLAWFLRTDRPLLRRIPPLVGLLVLAVLLATPVVLTAYSHRQPASYVFLTVLWNFFGAGFGEEIFFRGYLQSRVNEAFGRPWTFLRVSFGPGLLVSSLLFGFIHALNTVDYFEGHYEFAWLWMLVNFCAGLFFGIMRERTGSILPGAITHGLQDVLASIPSLLP
jgi:membrane protease YdiL (CAAX protease family)